MRWWRAAAGKRMAVPTKRVPSQVGTPRAGGGRCALRVVQRASQAIVNMVEGGRMDPGKASGAAGRTQNRTGQPNRSKAARGDSNARLCVPADNAFVQASANPMRPA